MNNINWSIVDAHAHLDMSEFDKDRDEVIARALDAGVENIITVGTDFESSKKAIELAEKYPQVLAAVGIHPHEANGVNRAQITSLTEIAHHSRVVAIGELGLDFYRNYSPREAQLRTFKWQLDLAMELELPVIIHCRQAQKEIMEILYDWVSACDIQGNERRGVIHRFSGTKDTAERYLNMGFYLSVGAHIGYPSSKNLWDVLRYIPEDRLMVETDCPYLPPQIYRGKRNEPSYLPLTIGILAEIRGEEQGKIAGHTTQNAVRLFRLSLETRK